jgi:uncharacterized membrane protein YgdD (TMEM256/DUF423 family)
MDAVASGGDDDRIRRKLAAIAAVMGLLGVLIGAFGAHGLDTHLTKQFSLSPEVLAKRLDQFDVGARYHLVHAVALLAMCGLSSLSRTTLQIAAGLMIGGIVLFSGSLYVLVVTNTPWLGAITPIGGASWIIGWAVIAAGALRAP